MTKSEKPILFSSPMVRSILEDRKTQTRRVIKPQPTQRYKAVAGNAVFHFDGGKKMRSFVGPPEKVAETLPPICPYGKPGDCLWVRETWAPHDASTLTNRKQSEIFYRADGEFPDDGSWRPSIYLPRWASRLTLEIVAVRVERLQEIKAKDIVAEGAVLRPHHDKFLGKCPISAFDGKMYFDLKSLWAAGWDSINGKRKGCAWNDNLWVWCLTFKRVERTAV